MKKYYGFILAFLIGIMTWSVSVFAYDYPVIETKWNTPNFQETGSSPMLTEVYEGSVSENELGQLYQIVVPKTGRVRANWNIEKQYEDSTISGVMKTQLYSSNKKPIGEFEKQEGNCLDVSSFSEYYLNAGTYYIGALWCEKYGVDDEGEWWQIRSDDQEPDVLYSVYFEYSVNEECTFDNSKLTKKQQKRAVPVPFATRIKGQKSDTISKRKRGNYYKIMIPEDGNVQICVDVPLKMMVLLTGRGYTKYPFQDEENRDEYYNIRPDAGDDDLETTLYLKKGTYYIVLGDGDESGIYEFELHYEKDALETFRVSAKSDTQFRVTAEKAGGISGYQIRYKYGNKKWKKKTIRTEKKLNRIIGKCKKGETYSVQLRTYYLNDGKKLFSQWSDTKTVKM